MTDEKKTWVRDVVTNAETVDMSGMAPMTAARLKGMIAKYSSDRATAFATADVRMKPNRRVKRETDPLVPLIPPEVKAQQVAIDAEIDRLYKVVDNVYPQKMFETFCGVSGKVADRAHALFIEALAHGADGSGVKETAELFCEYNRSVQALNTFAEVQKAKLLSPFATMAALSGIGTMLLMNYFGNRKKP